MIETSLRLVKRTGMCRLGWMLSFGFVKEKRTVESKVWCVTDDGKVIAECRSKSVALMIEKALTVKP